MYNNIGTKIKTMAKVFFAFTTPASVLLAIILMIDSVEVYWWHLFILIGAPCIALISAWLMYGFGEAVDKLCEIEKNTGMTIKPSELKKTQEANNEQIRQETESAIKAESAKIVEDERLTKIEKLRSQGLITEEEYQQVSSKKAKGE